MFTTITIWYGRLLIIYLVTFISIGRLGVLGARKVNARERLKSRFQDRRRSVDVGPSIRHVLDYQESVELVPQFEQTNCQGNTVVKLKENVSGKNIYDASVTVTMSKQNGGVDASGHLYEDVNINELFQNQRVTETEAMEIAINYNKDKGSAISRISTRLDVYLDKNIESHLAFFIDYISITNDGPKRPFTVVDARDGTILLSLNILDTCKTSLKAYGGNVKIGRIHYGKASRCLEMHKKDNICQLENKFVRVIDMNSSMDDTITETATFLCNKTYNDSVNGAFSPAMDALFYGTTVARMFTDWYSITPLKSTILLRVHYSTNFTDAFWDGLYCSFGDSSADGYFPMVSLDIVGHEIGHGITEQFSNLLYMGESGGINEAFSDMTGEVAEEYIGTADWMVGYSITRNDKGIRYFSDPDKDNVSITHIRDYTGGMDAHVSSGIYRRVFYLLVNQFGLPMRKVYEVFLFANQMYWHKLTTFIDGACDVMKAALDLGSSVKSYAKAFEQVGIHACNVNEHLFWLRDQETYSGIFVSSDTQPIFGFSVPSWARSIFINTKSVIPVTITLYNAGSLSEGDYYVITTGRFKLTYRFPEPKNTNLFIHLSSETNYMVKNVTLVASYRCMENFTSQNELNYLNFLKDCKGDHGKTRKWY